MTDARHGLFPNSRQSQARAFPGAGREFTRSPVPPFPRSPVHVFLIVAALSPHPNIPPENVSLDTLTEVYHTKKEWMFFQAEHVRIVVCCRIEREPISVANTFGDCAKT